MSSEHSLEQKKAERALLWKVDLILMPILTITLGLQYYDKAVLGSASIFGIIADLHLSQVIGGKAVTTRYSTATAAFYWGYLIAVLPVALLFARLPLAKSAAVAVFFWGVVCILTVVVTSYQGLVVQRVFLGLLESAVSPAFVAVTCLWYKPSEQTTRLGIWYSATGVRSATIAWSVVIWFLLPNSPQDPGRFFNAAEREILLARFAENPYGKEKLPFKRDQAIEAVLDVKTWIYLLLAVAIYMCNGAVTAFGGIIVKSFGYTSLQSIAHQIPGGAFTCITIYLFAYPCNKFKNIRTFMLPLSCIPVIVGALVIWLASWHPRAGPLFGYFFVATFGAPYVILLALASANVIGSTKKAITTGAIFIGYNVGNITAAYLVFADEKAIKYRSTWIALIVCMAFTIVTAFVLRYMYSAENKRRNTALAAQTHVDLSTDEKLGDPEIIDQVYVDLTDKQRKEFRYSL
ncbi:MFS transporter, ACS family, allantoate permease, partial [Tremellales sp. Uapishka_1]